MTAAYERECAAYIRDYYRVPAEVGGRVMYSGGEVARHGTITGFRDAYLLILLDGERISHPYHPTWKIEYLPAVTE